MANRSVRSPWRLWGPLLAAVVLVAVVVGAVALTRDRTPNALPFPDPTSAASSSAPVTTSSGPSATVSASAPASAGPRATSAPPSATATSAPTAADPTTKPPVAITEKAKVAPELTASVPKLEAVKGEAQGPGEVAGPAIRATVLLTNTGTRRLDLSNTVVNLYYTAEKTPGSVLSGPGSRRLPATLAPGASARGVFVYAVPTGQRQRILITVDYSVTTPIVAFTGRGPT